jgi:2-polyprenyl-3-methyl-5-hydroxy-6-metoxy-1,4-benzoquinol methylase
VAGQAKKENHMNNRVDALLASISGKVLDVGGSAGTLHEKLMKKIDEKNVISLDIEIIAVRTNQVIGDGQKMPFRNNSFNSILAGELIEHIEDPEKFLNECWRVLENNGVLALSTPNKKSWLNRTAKSYEMPLHLSLFSPEELKKLLKKTGFTVQTMNLFPYTSESSDGAQHKWMFPIRKLIHNLVPSSLRENMVLAARKIPKQ